MAKFRDIAKGKRARKPVELTLGGNTWTIDVRVLGPDEDLAIIADAMKMAKAKGSENPGPGDELFNASERVLTLLRACVDHDSPEHAPEPFFDSVDEIITSPDLTRDHLAFLYEQQASWQDECSPLRRTLTMPEFISAVVKTAEGDIGPFANMAPGMQWGFVHTMASRLMSSQTLSSDSLPSSTATSN